MISGALAGLLKVGAVALTAGGLATGIYLAVQVGQEEDANRAQTGEPPGTTSTALSPPNQVVTQPTITPTYILAPSPTAPTGVDTRDWKTYSSPDGYSFKYPPDWTVVPWPGELRVVSPETLRAIEQESPGPARPGMATVTFFFEQSDGFPIDAIIDNCEQPDPNSDRAERPDSASVVTFLGRRAVQCLQSGKEADAEWVSLGYTIELPPDKVINIGGYVVPQRAVTFATIEAVAASFALESGQ